MANWYYEGLVKCWAEAESPEQGDFKNDEGLWMCGNCKTPRQKIVKNKFGEIDATVWQNCQCREKEWLEREARREREKDEKVKEWRKEQQLKSIRNIKNLSLMGPKLERARFECAQTTRDNERNLKLCRSYVNKFEKMEENSQGFLFWGDVGTGKSYAAGCIANALIEKGVSVLVTSLVKLIEEMSAFDKNGHSEDVDRIMKQLCSVRLLILDELGAERYTKWTMEKIYQIIDARYNADLPVIVTTNLTLNELKGEQGMDKKRVYSRILEKCYPLCWYGESWRHKQAGERFDEMLRLLEE